jgi:hypothetical protein
MAKTKMTEEEKKARRAERRKARKAAAAAAAVAETAPEKTKKPRRSKKTKTEEPVDEMQFVTINGHEVSKEIAERGVTVICDPVKPKKKAEPKKYPNGEYVPEPKNFTQLKNYVTTYFRAMKWKNREGDYTFPDSNVHIRDFKLTKMKAEKAIRVEFNAVILTPKTMLAKAISKDYTLENHKQVRTDIINVYREVKNTKLVNGDKVKEKELLKRNWSKVY